MVEKTFSTVFEKVTGIKTCHSPVTFAGYGTTLTFFLLFFMPQVSADHISSLSAVVDQPSFTNTSVLATVAQKSPLLNNSRFCNSLANGDALPSVLSSTVEELVNVDDVRLAVQKNNVESLKKILSHGII